MYQEIRMQLRLNADAGRVWHALTDSGALRAWFAEHADIDLDAKRYDFWGRYTLGVPGRDEGRNAIVALEPGRRLTFDWRVGADETRVTYTLRPAGDGTILVMRHGHAPGGASGEADQRPEDFWFLILENLRRYVDGKPSDARVDFTDPMRGMIRHETDIDAPALVVFDVLTNPDHLNRWIATDASVTPEVGGDYNFGWIVDGVDAGAARIIDIVPGKRIAAETPDFGPEYPPSVMTWELEESGGKTRMIFTHSGFADDADVRGIYTGWRAFLNWVRSIAEYGDDWQPPISELKPDAVAYPKAMYQLQTQLLPE